MFFKLLTLILLFSLTFFTLPLFSQSNSFPYQTPSSNPQTEAKAHTGELLYQFKDHLQKLTTHKIYEVFKPQTKNLSAQSLEKVRQKMINSDQFKFVVYNTVEKQLNKAEQGSLSSAQWHHQQIKSEQAWEITKGSSLVTVAVCDSGVESKHKAFKNKLVEGWNFRTNNRDTSPQTTHGTFVAGLIVGEQDQNHKGIAPNVKVMPLVITNKRGSTTLKIIADCIQYAADHGAQVINVSFTGINSPLIAAAGRYARDKGSLLVYAAGNHGKRRSLEHYPDWDSVLAVGATNKSDTRWKYGKLFNKGGSNFGYFIDIVAPGHNIVSANAHLTFHKNNPYRKGSGTSYSAPLVSAVAALIFSLNKNFSPDQVENILVQSADRIGSAFVYGAGRINAMAAVNMANQ